MTKHKITLMQRLLVRCYPRISLQRQCQIYISGKSGLNSAMCQIIEAGSNNFKTKSTGQKEVTLLAHALPTHKYSTK